MSAAVEPVSWHERARRLEFRTQAFIDGRYLDAASGATFDCVNPASGKLLARVAAGDTEDIDRAVTSARAVVMAHFLPDSDTKNLVPTLQRAFESMNTAEGAGPSPILTTSLHQRQPEDRYPGRGALRPVVRGSDRQGV